MAVILLTYIHLCLGARFSRVLRKHLHLVCFPAALLSLRQASARPPRGLPSASPRTLIGMPENCHRASDSPSATKPQGNQDTKQAGHEVARPENHKVTEPHDHTATKPQGRNATKLARSRERTASKDSDCGSSSNSNCNSRCSCDTASAPGKPYVEVHFGEF